MIRSQLARNRVTLLHGTGRFADPHTIGVDGGDGHEHQVTADKIVIAAGTRPARPDSVDFDDRTIIDSDGDHQPRQGAAQRWSWSAPA